MKKVISILVLLIGFNAMAQKRQMTNLSPEQVATLQTKKMTLALDLNEGQQTKIHQLNLENAKTRKAKMDERKKSKEDGGTKKLSSDERFALKTQMLDNQIAQKKKIKSILTTEQFEKWEKMQHHKMNKRHGRKGGEGKKKEDEKKRSMTKENK